MDNQLLKVRKLIITSMFALVLLLVVIFVASLTLDTGLDIKKLLTFGVLLPLLLAVVLGIAYFARKFKSVQQNFMMVNENVLKRILGSGVQYRPSGQIPFNRIQSDPSISAKQANSCRSEHILVGKYKGFDFVASNMRTFQSRGYATVDHSIFDGYYLLVTVNTQSSSPFYVCSNDFWDSFHVKDELVFEMNELRLQVIHDLLHYKVIAPSNFTLQAKDKKALDKFFATMNIPVSLHFYEDGRIGIAIRSFKAFQFSITPLQKTATDTGKARDIISRDAREIKSYLEALINSLPMRG